MQTALERFYWFYDRLKRGRYPNRSEYTAEFEISGSTFKRDLEFFRDRFRAPVVYDQARRGYRLADESFELPSFWFSRPHLFLMLGTCGQIRLMAGGEPKEIRELRRRLEAILSITDRGGGDLLFSFENVAWSGCDCRHIDAVVEAIQQRRCLDLAYHAASTDRLTFRTVEPYRLHNYMGSWYLIGFCRGKNEPRTFLLGRIKSLALSGVRFAGNRFEVNSFVSSAFGIFKGEAAGAVILRFEAEPARYLRMEIWHEEQRLEELEDGGLRLTLPVADLTEIGMKVLQYGAGVVVEAPAALREMVAEEARKIVARYDT